MYKFFFLFLISVIFSSCEEKQSENDNLNEKLIKNKSIEIPIDKDVKYSYSYKQIIESKDSSKLLVSNLNDNGFLIFDLNNNSLIEKINYKRNGPNGIRSSSSGRKFYYHNKDTIFIIGQQSKKVFLTNCKSEVKDFFDLSEISYFNMGEPIVENRIPASFKNDILSFCVYPFVGSNIRKSSNGPVIVHLNIKTRKIQEGPLIYELANQFNQHPALHFPSGTKNGESDVYCFPFDNKLYIVTGKSYITKNFKSKYVDEYKPMTKSLQFLNDFDITGTYNELILYDKHNNLYYLFISLGIDKIDSKSGLKSKFTEKPFSLLVLDSNFNKLYEKKFSGGNYLVRNSFVTKKGLYLFKNNPENSDFEENLYKFDVFNFIKEQ